MMKSHQRCSGVRPGRIPTPCRRYGGLYTGLALLALICGCAHVVETRATFIRQPGNSSAPLVLKITRHVDTILYAPDIEEDQILMLEVKQYELGQRMAIPSDDVTAQFDVTRSGPRSRGESFEGYVIVRSVSEQKIIAHVHLVVTARTTDGSYVQKARYHSDFTFFSKSSGFVQ